MSELHEKSKSEEDQTITTTQTTPTPNPNHFVTVIEVTENLSNSPQKEKEPAKKPEARRYENVIIETKTENVHLSTDEQPASKLTSTFTGGSVLATAALFSSNDTKKKIPPRLPPKFVGKRAPLVPIIPPTVTSPKNSAEVKSSSLDRNVNPSKMLRQKSSDSLDIPPVAAARTFAGEPHKLSRTFGSNDEVEDHAHKVDKHKSTSIGNIRKPSDEASPSCSFSKDVQKSSDAGSMESLGSTGIISERVMKALFFSL